MNDTSCEAPHSEAFSTSYEVPHCVAFSTPHCRPSWAQIFASGSFLFLELSNLNGNGYTVIVGNTDLLLNACYREIKSRKLAEYWARIQAIKGYLIRSGLKIGEERNKFKFVMNGYNIARAIKSYRLELAGHSVRIEASWEIFSSSGKMINKCRFITENTLKYFGQLNPKGLDWLDI